MNLLTTPLNSALPPAALWVLADAAIKSALLLLSAALLAVFLRKSSAAARHLTWSGAVAGTLLLPLLSFLLPAWRAPWLPDWSEVKIAVVRPVAAIVSPPASVSIVQATTVSVHETTSAPTPTTVAIATAPTPFPIWSLALPLWLAGAALALLPLAAGAWQMARLTRRCSPITETEWLALQARVSSDLGLRRRVDLRQGPGVNAPLTWGAWRPVLLLPDTARAWSAERRRVVLLHELAHIKRWDWLTQTLAYLGCALYWFNPLAWLAARCMRIERERACDDLVLHHGSRPSDYADELLKFASTLGGSGLVNWAAVPMARRSTLEGRLLAILDARRNRSALTRAAVLAALALVAAVVVPIAMLRAAPDENPPAPAASIPATPAPTPAPLESNPPAPPSSVILRGTIFSVPPDVHVDPANTSVDQLLGQLSAASSVLITPAPVSTLPDGVSTGFKARNGFHFSNPTKWVVVDFQFHAQVDVTGGHLHYKIDSTHTPFPDATPSPPSKPMDDLRNIANSANDGSVMKSQDTTNPSLTQPITIVGNTTWNQSFICDLGPSGDDPASNYRVLAMFVFQPGPTAPINSITAPAAASTAIAQSGETAAQSLPASPTLPAADTSGTLFGAYSASPKDRDYGVALLRFQDGQPVGRDGVYVRGINFGPDLQPQYKPSVNVQAAWGMLNVTPILTMSMDNELLTTALGAQFDHEFLQKLDGGSLNDLLLGHRQTYGNYTILALSESREPRSGQDPGPFTGNLYDALRTKKYVAALAIQAFSSDRLARGFIDEPFASPPNQPATPPATGTTAQMITPAAPASVVATAVPSAAPLSLTANSTSGATIRIFPLRPSTLEILVGPLEDLYSKGQVVPTLKKVLTADGVNFDGDADVYYDSNSSQLVAKNTAANLATIGLILQNARDHDALATLETRSFPMPQATLTRLIGYRHESRAASDYAATATADDDPALKGAMDDLKNFFVNAGVAFPHGYRLAWDGTKIWVTNFPQNLDRLANLLQRYADEPAPTQPSPPAVATPAPPPPTAPLSLTPNSTSGETIRIFPLTPTTLAFLFGPLPPLSSDGQITAALQKVFQDNGVSFGDDDGLYYDLKTSQLVAKNTTDNLDRIAAILQKNREQEVIASMETRSFPMPQATLTRLTGYFKKSNGPGNSTATVNDESSANEAMDDLKNFFVNAGVAFPVGARLAYDGAKIWVTDTPQNLDRLANLLQRYSEIKQVQIDAKFLEVQQGVLQQLGFQWNVTNPSHPDNSVNTSGNLRVLGDALPTIDNTKVPASNTSASVDPTVGQPTGNLTAVLQVIPTMPSGINVGAGISADTFNTLNSQKNGDAVQTIINALEQTQGASLMSAPKVTVLSEKEAEISVAQSGLKPPNSSYATDPLGVTFKVLPVVKDDNSLDYSIKAWITELVSAQSAAGGVVQHTNVTELVTSGHALDGQTVAFDLSGEPPPSPNPAPSGNTTTATPPPAPGRHRYAIFTFNIIHSDGTFALVTDAGKTAPAPAVVSTRHFPNVGTPPAQQAAAQ